MSDSEPGLRERKRRATKLAIQQAALRITIEQGLAALTVDEISRRADVSPRTFFNYFPSKEQALLGDDPTLVDEAAVAEFVAGDPDGDLLPDLGALLARSTQEMIDDRELMPERHRVLKSNPELFSQRMTLMKEFSAELATVIAQRIANDTGAPVDHPDVTRRARLASLVAMAAVRHAWSEWSVHDGAVGLVECVAAAFTDLDTLVSRELV